MIKQHDIEDFFFNVMSRCTYLLDRHVGKAPVHIHIHVHVHVHIHLRVHVHVLVHSLCTYFIEKRSDAPFNIFFYFKHKEKIIVSLNDNDAGDARLTCIINTDESI